MERKDMESLETKETADICKILAEGGKEIADSAIALTKRTATR
jgi:hypothetical protein